MKSIQYIDTSDIRHIRVFDSMGAVEHGEIQLCQEEFVSVEDDVAEWLLANEPNDWRISDPVDIEKMTKSELEAELDRQGVDRSNASTKSDLLTLFE